MANIRPVICPSRFSQGQWPTVVHSPRNEGQPTASAIARICAVLAYRRRRRFLSSCFFIRKIAVIWCRSSRCFPSSSFVFVSRLVLLVWRGREQIRAWPTSFGNFRNRPRSSKNTTRTQRLASSCWLLSFFSSFLDTNRQVRTDGRTGVLHNALASNTIEREREPITKCAHKLMPMQ